MPSTHDAVVELGMLSDDCVCHQLERPRPLPATSDLSTQVDEFAVKVPDSWFSAEPDVVSVDRRPRAFEEA